MRMSERLGIRYGGGFWGFISDTPFTSVKLIGSDWANISRTTTWTTWCILRFLSLGLFASSVAG